jgi:hypothetical protein
MLMEQKLNTESGTLSDQSWLLVFLEDWITFTLPQEPKFSTLVLQMELLSVM